METGYCDCEKVVTSEFSVGVGQLKLSNKMYLIGSHAYYAASVAHMTTSNCHA